MEPLGTKFGWPRSCRHWKKPCPTFSSTWAVVVCGNGLVAGKVLMPLPKSSPTASTGVSKGVSAVGKKEFGKYPRNAQV